MKKYLQLLKNIGLFGISNFASKLITFFLLPLYTAYLTTSEYATVDLATVLQSLLWPIFSLSLTDGLLRFALDKNYNKKYIFSICLVFSLPGIIITFFIFNYINFNDQLYTYRVYFWLYYFIVSVNQMFSVFARTIEKINLILLNSIITSGLTAILSIVFLIKLKLGINGYFLALILGNFVSIVSYFVLGNYKTYITFRINNHKLIKEIFRYSIPMIPNSIFWWINSSLDKLCLTAMVGLSEVGLYSVAGKISAALNIVTGIFSQAWSISAIQEYDSKGYNDFLSNIYIIYNSVIILTSCILLLFNITIAKILFVGEFFSAWKYVPILIFAFYFNALNIYYGSIFSAYKKTNIIFYTTGSGAIINLIMNILFIKYFGTIGASIATLISNVVVYIFRRKYIAQFVRIKYKTFLDILLFITLGILVIFSTVEFSVIFKIMLFIIVIFLIYLYDKDIIKKSVWKNLHK